MWLPLVVAPIGGNAETDSSLLAIEFTRVSKRFGHVAALQDVSLSVQEGEFLSLIGPSGCGKTTMLRIAAGLELPTAGEVLVDGDTPQNACRLHRIGVAFQRPALLASRTALGNVRMTLEITGRADALSPDDLLTDFGLGEFQHHYPHQLSGGMRQRVNIAAALVHNPPILLLDEPFGALDELTRESMSEWLGGVLSRSAKTVIFVTHSVEEATILSDRVAVLSARPGRISEIIDIELPGFRVERADDVELLGGSPVRSRAIRTDENFLREVARVRSSLYRAVELSN